MKKQLKSGLDKMKKRFTPMSPTGTTMTAMDIPPVTKQKKRGIKKPKKA